MARGLTSDELIVTTRRRANIPDENSSRSKQDALDILNEELQSYVMPIILKAHQAFFSYDVKVPLEALTTRYKIPYRTIGGHIEDVQVMDNSGGFCEMARIKKGDRPEMLNNYRTQDKFKFYLENDSIVIMSNTSSTLDSLVFGIFLRPNKLVSNSRGSQITAIGTDFSTITINTYASVVGQTFSFNGFSLIGVSGSAGTGEFQCTGNANTTATNLASAINSDSDISALMTASASNSIITISMLSSSVRQTITYDGSTEITLSLPQVTLTLDQIPAHFATTSVFDLVQYVSSNKILVFDITLTNLNSTNSTISFNRDDIGLDAFGATINYGINDYVMAAEETIVPQIPLEFQTLLAQKAACKLLEAMGDGESYKIAAAELRRLEENLGTLLYNRVEESPLKVRDYKNTLHTFSYMNNRRIR